MLPKQFIDILLAFLKERYLSRKFEQPWNEKDTAYFARGIIRLSEIFTSSRKQGDRDYFRDPVLRSGYLAYFLPINAVKTAQILVRGAQQYPEVIFPRSKTEFRIADLGCGPLTMTLGFIFALIHLKQAPRLLTVDAFERNPIIVKDGISLLKKFCGANGIQFDVRAVMGDVSKKVFQSRPYDFVFVGNVFNEFPDRSRQVGMARKIYHHLCAEDTKILFLEPASKKSSRDLQNLRDEILRDGQISVLAPCLHQNTCPLNIVAKSDWCHFQHDWQAPEFIKDFDRVAQLKKTYLLYSYLLMLKGQKLVPHKEEEFIAISDAMRARGGFEIIGCGEAGRVRFFSSGWGAAKMRRGALFTVKAGEPFFY